MEKLQEAFLEQIVKVAYNVIENNIEDFSMFAIYVAKFKNEKTEYKTHEYLNLAFKRSGIKDHAKLLFDQHRVSLFVLAKNYPRNIVEVKEILTDMVIDVLKPRTSMHYNDLIVEIQDSFQNFKYYQNRYCL